MVALSRDNKPTGMNNKPVCHWFKTNILRGDLTTGEDLIKYNVDFSKSTETKQLIFLLLQQREILKDVDIKKISNWRNDKYLNEHYKMYVKGAVFCEVPVDKDYDPNKNIKTIERYSPRFSLEGELGGR